VLRKNDHHFNFGRQQGTEVLPYVPREGLFWLRYEAITDAGLAEEMARFLNPDPLTNSLTAGIVNRYAYVENRPAVNVDPLGVWSWDPLGTAAGWVGEKAQVLADNANEFRKEPGAYVRATGQALAEGPGAQIASVAG